MGAVAIAALIVGYFFWWVLGFQKRWERWFDRKLPSALQTPIAPKKGERQAYDNWGNLRADLEDSSKSIITTCVAAGSPMAAFASMCGSMLYGVLSLPLMMFSPWFGLLTAFCAICFVCSTLGFLWRLMFWRADPPGSKQLTWEDDPFKHVRKMRGDL